jgi:hypothetical protein
MQRRASDRIPSNFTVRFSCCNCDYEGTVMNLSEDGMFITTNRMSFPFDSELEILVDAGSEILRVPKLYRVCKESQICLLTLLCQI